MRVPTHISTDRLILRPFEAQDMTPYVAYYTGPRTSGVGGPKPKHVVAERFLAMAGQWAIRGFGRYAIATDETSPAIGHVGMLQIESDQTPELSWTLWDEADTGKGYATEAAQAAMDAWFESGAHSCLAHVEPKNSASIAVAKRIGMTHDSDMQPPAWGPNFLCYVKRAA